MAERVVSGVHSIQLNEQFLDVLIENRGSRVTLVVFHSALTKSMLTTPVFQGRGIAEKYGVNLISVADPSVEIGKLSLGWHIGNKHVGSMKPTMGPVLNYSLLSLDNEGAVLYGSS